MTSPWSKAGPSRAGPWRRSSRVCGTILLHLMQIRFVLLPEDIPNVSTSQEKLPLILRNGLRMVRTVKLFRRARARHPQNAPA
jgi:hypothetical protein